MTIHYYPFHLHTLLVWPISNFLSIWLQFVYDRDTFTFDDKMGDAEFEIGTLLKVVAMRLEGLPDGTIISKVKPNRQNCLAEDSCIVYSNGKIIQNMVLRLRNVECGEIELQLQWIDVSGSKHL